MEVGGEPPAPVIGALLAEASRRILEQSPDAQSVTALLSEAHPFIEGFKRAGFMAREEAERVVAYAPAGSDVKKFLEGNPRWLFQFADVTA